jgi:hypothetical protein
VTGSWASAEGWYRDPYGIHQDRWFSAGTPTSLVRDGGTEGHDDPPGYPPAGSPVEIPDADRFPEDDLRRADEAEARLEESADLRRADDAEADAGQGDRPTPFDRASDAEMPGFAGEETR